MDISTKRGFDVNSKSLGERKVRAVATLLVPTLDSSADGAGDDGQIERPGDSPLVGDLSLEDHDLVGVEFVLAMDILVGVGVLSDQCALLQYVSVLGDALLLSKLLDLGHELMPGDAREWVLDLGLDIGREVGAFDC